MKGYDIIGNIAIVKFSRDSKAGKKKKWAERFLKEHKAVRTVLEKSEKIKGRLRVPKTKFISGERTREALYRENGCVFRLNVDRCYFSPRLASERKEISGKVKKGENVLVMFGGVGPYAIVIGKLSKASKVVSVELGRECNKYAKENVKRNKLEKKIEIVQGDVRRRVPKLKEKFDRIIMARPNLRDSFLDVAFSRVKKGGVVYYYGFTGNRKFPVPKTLKKAKRVSGYPEEEKKEMLEMIRAEARKERKKIKILKVVKAGEIGVRKFRYRTELKVLN